jgi:DNA-binding NarL/FixJ family response regulator
MIGTQMSAPLLLVDDDPTFRRLATQILRNMGIELIAEAETAAAGIAKAQSLRPEAALVDVGLPDLDGIELAHQLATLPWRPAVVLISADRDAAAGVDLSGANGALAFVPKDELPNAPLRSLLRLD